MSNTLNSIVAKGLREAGAALRVEGGVEVSLCGVRCRDVFMDEMGKNQDGYCFVRSILFGSFATAYYHTWIL